MNAQQLRDIFAGRLSRQWEHNPRLKMQRLRTPTGWLVRTTTAAGAVGLAPMEDPDHEWDWNARAEDADVLAEQPDHPQPPARRDRRGRTRTPHPSELEGALAQAIRIPRPQHEGRGNRLKHHIRRRSTA